MNWTKLVSKEQLESIQKESQDHPVVIFKHSTSCSISKASLARLERNWKVDDLPEVPLYLLDLLKLPRYLQRYCPNLSGTARIASGFNHSKWSINLRQVAL
jgi:hypothetical protein